MQNSNGFSLVEIVVVISILSLLVTSVFFVGFPEYNRYLIYSERDYFIDTFLESRARLLVSGTTFVVSTWSDGYCIKDISGLCVGPVHNLPSSMTLTSMNFATSTKMIISGNSIQVEINIDQNGFIDGR